MSAAPLEAWRVFPWDRDAANGTPFSPGWVPHVQGQGRFDLPGSPGGVLYLAETPAHAVAEMIQHYRGQRIDEADLRLSGYPLALARVEVPEEISARLADLCDPVVLVHLGVPPDAIAGSKRRTTQRIAAEIHAAGYSGIRWWSALRGEWHTLVLFVDRLEGALRFDPPVGLTLAHVSVREAMRELGMSGARAGR